jgi:hypothetical protein
MLQHELSCIVFMPFREDLSFVYDLGIKSALKQLTAARPDFSFTPERADERLVIDEDKVSRIIQILTRSNLVIVDITDYSPNVLWELGFAQALGKPVVILSQATKDLPFNIRTRDVVHYTFSTHGLESLSKELFRKLLPALDGMVLPLRYDDEIYTLSESIHRGLGQLERESILRNLVRNEMERLERRIAKLQAGNFDLRNEKPNKEIIRYFCDYVSQLNSGDSRYDTISVLPFWREITDDGKDFNYLTANIQAARAGARIRRVFLVDGKQFPGDCVAGDSLFQRILAEHYHKTGGCGDRIQTRVFFTQNYSADRNTYKNFAVWRKGLETMLFVPGYREHDDHMAETIFTYHHQAKAEAAYARANKEEIDKYDTRFLEVWNRSAELSPRHFGGVKSADSGA